MPVRFSFVNPSTMSSICASTKDIVLINHTHILEVSLYETTRHENDSIHSKREGRRIKMNISEYNYLWGEEKNDWVLVHTEYGYSIVNKSNQMVLLVSDEELEDALIERMIQEGNQRYDNINEAFEDR